MPQHPKLRSVVPVHDADHDNEQRREEHYLIFGHFPPENPSEKCQHPLHAAVRREMNGMTLEVPFDGDAIVSDDSEVGRERKERYDRIFQATRQFQKQVEEEDRLERMKEAGLIPAKLVY
jgi:hypothetical protein